MELQFTELENGIRFIKPIGKLDIGEMRESESEFILHCVGSQAQVIIDLSEVTAVTSSGVKLLLWTAKEVVSRGGRFVLINSHSGVEQALENKELKEWTSSYPDIDTATSFLLTPKPKRVPFPSSK